MILKDLLDTYKDPLFKDEEYIAIVRVNVNEEGNTSTCISKVFDAWYIHIERRKNKEMYFPVCMYETKMEKIGMDVTVLTDGEKKPVLYIYIFDPTIDDIEWRKF